MAKVKNKEKEEKKKLDTPKIAGIVLLLIMVFSLGGFALMMGGNYTSSNGRTMPENMDLRQVSQNGTNYWVAIKGGEQFVFRSVNGYEAMEGAKSIATRLKEKNSVDLYVTEDFNFNEPQYIIDNVLKGYNINSNTVEEMQCNKDTLVFATNSSQVEGECMKFIAEDDEMAYRRAKAIVYHMVK